MSSDVNIQQGIQMHDDDEDGTVSSTQHFSMGRFQGKNLETVVISRDTNPALHSFRNCTPQLTHSLT